LQKPDLFNGNINIEQIKIIGLPNFNSKAHLRKYVKITLYVFGLYAAILMNKL